MFQETLKQKKHGVHTLLQCVLGFITQQNGKQQDWPWSNDAVAALSIGSRGIAQAFLFPVRSAILVVQVGSCRYPECHLSHLVCPFFPLSLFVLHPNLPTNATPTNTTPYLHQARWRRFFPLKLWIVMIFFSAHFSIANIRNTSFPNWFIKPGDLIAHIRPPPRQLPSLHLIILVPHFPQSQALRSR